MARDGTADSTSGRRPAPSGGGRPACYHCPDFRPHAAKRDTERYDGNDAKPNFPLSVSRPSQLLAAAAVAAILLTQPLRAADDAVTLNFVNADIDAVIRAVGEMTGRNFVLDPRVKGVVNIVSATPVPRALIYPTLLSALRLQGLAAIEGPGGVTKIVPEAEAKQQGMPVVTGPVTVGGDRLVTAVYMLKFESATQLVNVLRPLITPNNAIAAVPTANALVITDYAENLKRIDRIIASLDVAPAGEPIVVPLRNASALDIVPMLQRLLADTAPGAGAVADAQQRLTLVADARSNSVLVRGENAARLARVRALIAELDTPGRAGGNISIIYLKNADAVRVARTLRALFTGGGDAGELTPGASLAPNAGGLASGGMTTATAAGAGATATVTASPVAGNAAGFAAAGVTIQADAANNALLVMASEPLYNNIRAVVDKLDVRRAQIYRRSAGRGGLGRQGRRIRHSVESARSEQVDQQRNPGRRWHELRHARHRHQHHRRAVEPGRAGAGAEPRHHSRHDQHPWPGHNHQSRLAGARSGIRREHQHTCRRRTC